MHFGAVQQQIQNPARNKLHRKRQTRNSSFVSSNLHPESRFDNHARKNWPPLSAIPV